MEWNITSRGSRTDGSRLDHVADGEALDGLVLGGAASAVGAAHGLDVAAAILVTTAKEILLVPMFPCGDAIHDIQSPFGFDSSVNARMLVLASIFIFVHLEGLWRGIEFVGVIAEIHIEWETGFADRWRKDQVLLVRPLLDHFDGLLCGKSESRSGMERRKEGEGNVRVSCREWVVEARSHRRSAGMDGWLCCGKP